VVVALKRSPTLEVHPMFREIKGETAFTFLALARKLMREGRRVISFGIGLGYRS
jgi:hypothetical protein